MVLKPYKGRTTPFGVWKWCKNVWYSNPAMIAARIMYVWEWCKNVWYSNITQTLIFVKHVWEWCKNVWYSNQRLTSCESFLVWEWCKNVWYSNYYLTEPTTTGVWEWCKNVWYSNGQVSRAVTAFVWEWCKNVWYSNHDPPSTRSSVFENDVKTYGTQTSVCQIWLVAQFENDEKRMLNWSVPKSVIRVWEWCIIWFLKKLLCCHPMGGEFLILNISYIAFSVFN